MVYAGLRQRDEALDALEDAVQRHDVRLILLNVDHKWDLLRHVGRFVAILDRLGFEH
ncbi:MAG: hypothetical protein ABI481_10515 [Pyrinomonadaceae bacterium]